jgi:hypothetical protein
MSAARRAIGWLCAGSLAIARWATFDTAAQIPHYADGEPGMFGNWEGRHFNSSLNLNSTDDLTSARFRAREDVTVDRAWQRLISVDPGYVLEIGIMADNGSGVPSGTFLTSGTLTFTGAVFGGVTCAVFASSVALTNGHVYHLVTNVLQDVPAQTFNVYYGPDFPVCPFDRALDPDLQMLRVVDGGPWTSTAGDPYFVPGHGSAVVAGPSQPVGTSGGNGFIATRGGASAAGGERFVITDKEVPTNYLVVATQLVVAATTAGSPSNNFVLRLRTADSAILASCTMTVAQADSTLRANRLDRPVILTQGIPYLLTGEFDGTGHSNTQYYRICATRSDDGPGFGVASWGGTNVCYPIQSGPGGNWTTYSGYSLDNDVQFRIDGIVRYRLRPAGVAIQVW